MESCKSDPWGFMNIPTRLNVHSDSAERCAAFHVYLDGVEQTQAIIADANQGYVTRYKLNVLGFRIPSGIRKGHYKTETIKGVVTFETKAEVMAKFEASRDIDAEILASVEEMKRGEFSQERFMKEINGTWEAEDGQPAK